MLECWKIASTRGAVKGAKGPGKAQGCAKYMIGKAHKSRMRMIGVTEIGNLKKDFWGNEKKRSRSDESQREYSMMREAETQVLKE